MSELLKTKFLVQLAEFGVRKVIFSFDFVFSFAFFILMLLSNKYSWDIFITSFDDNKNMIVTVFAVASTMFSITLAALAIILSFSSSQFMRFLKSKNKLSGILFPFWLGNASYLLVLLCSSAYLILNNNKFSFVSVFLFPLICSIFVYSILNTFYLLASVIRFGYFSSWVEENSKNQ